MRGDTALVVDAIALAVVIVGVFVGCRVRQHVSIRSAMCDRCGGHLYRFGGGCSRCY